MEWKLSFNFILEIHVVIGYDQFGTSGQSLHEICFNFESLNQSNLTLDKS